MDQSSIPEWALKYKAKGHTIKKLKNGYALYTCTSQYVPGGKPKSIQHFVGMITEEDGLIPKKTKSAAVTGTRPVEFGLSYFLFLNFYRQLIRMFNTDATSMDKTTIRLGIVLFVFGDIYPFSIASCALCIENTQEYLDIADRIRSKSHRCERIVKKIEALLRESIPNPEERSAVVNGLRLVTIDEGTAPPKEPVFPEKIRSIIERNGLRL